MLPNRLESLLQRLEAGGVDFILVGGLAGVLNGAPVTTFDVDIVHSRTPENIARTIGVLESLDAVFRLQPERRLKPNATHLAGPGHLNFTVGDGNQIRVLNLETLIELKQELAGQKDLAMLDILKQTLNEARKKRP